MYSSKNKNFAKLFVMQELIQRSVHWNEEIGEWQLVSGYFISLSLAPLVVLLGTAQFEFINL